MAQEERTADRPLDDALPGRWAKIWLPQAKVGSQTTFVIRLGRLLFWILSAAGAILAVLYVIGLGIAATILVTHPASDELILLSLFGWLLAVAAYLSGRSIRYLLCDE